MTLAWPHEGPRRIAVVAVATNGVMGADGDLPWHLPEDFAHFKATTLGGVMVMGRATWDSLGGRPLPRRRSIVVTRNESWTAEGAEVAHDLESAYERAGDVEAIHVIGGAQLFQDALPTLDRIVLSEVHQMPLGDTYFPRIDTAAWRESSRDRREGFDIVTLDRFRADRPDRDAVRSATEADAGALGAVQAEVWRETYRAVLDQQVVASFVTDDFVRTWEASLQADHPAYRALVATEYGDVVGLAAVGPSADADASPAAAEISELCVHPAARRRGHGSRLLNAAVDVARTLGHEEVQVWAGSSDTPALAMLSGAGLEPDGAERRLDLGDSVVRQVRYHASMGEPQP